MKLGEAQSLYRAQRQTLLEQRKALVQQKDELETKSRIVENGKELYKEEAAKLELSIHNVTEQFEKNQEVLDQLAEKYAAVWNVEVARQQSDVMSEQAADLAKIMEVARRISKGARVPAQDEEKLMNYSMELYMASKNMAMLNRAKEKEEYDSLWGEETEKEEYDPQGKAENAEVSIDIPETIEENSIDVSV